MIIVARMAVFVLMVLYSTQASGSVLYSLTSDTTFSEGCVFPCMCPVIVSEHVSGTFLMGDAEPDPNSFYETYPIENIKWMVFTRLGELLHEITGSGVYRKCGGDTPKHQLELDISIDGRDPEHLDSGLVSDGLEFPEIFIDVSRGTECLDIWMTIKASPASIYFLGQGSTYSEGCIPPCMCPVWSGKLRGLFLMAKSGSDWLFDYYDVDYVRWIVLDSGEIHYCITGKGTYKIGGEVALMHQLELDISIDGGDPEHLDSGLLQGGNGFPSKLSIPLTLPDAECFGIWIEINAWKK